MDIAELAARLDLNTHNAGQLRDLLPELTAVYTVVTTSDGKRMGFVGWMGEVDRLPAETRDACEMAAAEQAGRVVEGAGSVIESTSFHGTVAILSRRKDHWTVTCAAVLPGGDRNQLWRVVRTLQAHFSQK